MPGLHDSLGRRVVGSSDRRIVGSSGRLSPEGSEAPSGRVPALHLLHSERRHETYSLYGGCEILGTTIQKPWNDGSIPL